MWTLQTLNFTKYYSTVVFEGITVFEMLKKTQNHLIWILNSWKKIHKNGTYSKYILYIK